MTTPTRRDVHVDAPMSNISIAYRNEVYVADRIFPIVPVVKQSGVYFIYTKADWFRDEAKPRAPGVPAAKSDWSMATNGTYVCVEYALSHPVADEIRDAADEPLRPEVESVEFLTDKLQLALERRVATLVTTSTNWTSTSAPGTTWDDDTSDPLGDIETARDTVVGLIGRQPNTLLLGYQVYSQLKQHPDLLDRIKYTERGVLTTDLMASLFEVDRVFVGSAIYTASVEAAATQTYNFIWGKNAWLGYVAPRPSLMAPSAGYVIRYKNREVSRFRQDEAHADLFEVRENADEIVTSADAGYLYTSAVA